MADYKLIKSPYDNTTDKVVLRKSDMAYIPYDENNRDYREYQEWLAAGNTPDAAD